MPKRQGAHVFLISRATGHRWQQLPALSNARKQHVHTPVAAALSPLADPSRIRRRCQRCRRLALGDRHGAAVSQPCPAVRWSCDTARRVLEGAAEGWERRSMCVPKIAACALTTHVQASTPSNILNLGVAVARERSARTNGAPVPHAATPHALRHWSTCVYLTEPEVPHTLGRDQQGCCQSLYNNLPGMSTAELCL